MKKIGVLIDSSSTIDEKFILENDIWIAPLSLADLKLNTYKDDNKEITREQIVDRLRNGENFKTSATPIGQLMSIVEKMFKKYENIIFLPISKGLSSQWQSSQIIKSEHPNFYIINSLSAAYTNEIILENIVSNIKNGNDISQIIANAETINDKTFNIFSVEETSGMKSGGRVTGAILRVIDVLKLQPIIRLNVKNEYAGITKNYQNGIDKMIKYAKKWSKTINGTIKRICVYTSGYNKQKFDFIKNALINAFQIEENQVCTRWIPTTVLVHTKLESYGFCAYIN